MALALAWLVHIGMVMNGREQMKQARARAMGRVRHPESHSDGDGSNRGALYVTLLELGAVERVAWWAAQSSDPLTDRAFWRPRRSKSFCLRLDILDVRRNGRGKGPLPLP